MARVPWEIVIPLLIAALLGLFCGWLMWRWRRTSVTVTEWETVTRRTREAEGAVHALTGERDELQRVVSGLRGDLKDARDEVAILEQSRLDTTNRAEALEIEFRAASARAESHAADLTAVHRQIETLAAERDDALLRCASLEADLATAERRVAHLEADLVIDLTVDASDNGGSGAMDNLLLIDGVGPKLEQFLHRRGITTFRQIAELDGVGVARLQSELPQFPGRIEREQWVAQAHRFLTEGVRIPARDERDDLKIIKGIGPVLERWLHGRQIYRLAQLAALDDAGIAALDGALEDFPGRIVREAWVPQARALIGSPQSARQ